MVARGHVVFEASVWDSLGDRGSTDATPPKLSGREFEVLQLLSRGLGNKEVADQLGISLETAKTHIDRLYKRLGVTTRTDAVAKALRAGIID